MCDKSLLFPCTSPTSNEKENPVQSSCLFPSVCIPSLNSKESFAWLSNKSYKDEGAKEDCPKVEEEGFGLESSQSSDDKETTKAESSEERRARRKRRKKEKSRKNKRKKYKKKSDDIISKLSKRPSTIWIEESGLDIDEAYRVHKKPDYNNIGFGGLYRLDVALHFTNPKLKCLGYNDWKSFEKRKDKKKSSCRYWEVQTHSSDDVIALDKTGNVGFGFSNNFSYVPLELPVKHVIDDKESPIDPNESHVSVLLNKTRDLNQRVRENVNDVDAWLALADHQALQVNSSSSTAESLLNTGVEKYQKFNKLSLEKKCSVLEQAVEKNPSCKELILVFMDVCSEIMSSEKVLEKWKQLLFYQPQRISLWRHYLLFSQSCFSVFSITTTVAIYTKCFTTLSAIQSGHFTSHQPENDIEEGMLQIVLQLLLFLIHSGQTEKAVAAFQALIEYNCFPPSDVNDESLLRSSFEDFWDSEVPRFGEDNAQGWGCWMEGQKSRKGEVVSLRDIFPTTASENVLSTSQVDIDHSQKSMYWLELETSRDDEQWYPKKSSDHEDDDDPDRVVLFHDINFVLFKFSREEICFRLLCCFLSFLGASLNVLHRECDEIVQLFLQDEQQFTSFIDGCENATKINSSRILFLRNTFHQSLRVFGGDIQSKVCFHWLSVETKLLTESGRPLSKHIYKSVRKLAKSLLKLEQHRNNLNLWFAYVQLEFVYGNWDEARSVVTSVLGQSRSVNDENVSMNNFRFVRMYCELEMGLKKEKKIASEAVKNAVITAIFSLVSGSSVQLTPAQILKNRKSLQDRNVLLLQDIRLFDEMTDKKKELVINFTICYSIFQYWSAGIDEAIKILDAMLAALQSVEITSFFGSKYNEDMMIFYSRLYRYHLETNFCSIKPLRDILDVSLKSFPENPFFLQSFVNVQLKSFTSYTIRRHFDHVLDKSSTPFPWFFAIQYEQHRHKTIQSALMDSNDFTQAIYSTQPSPTGVMHRLRSVYERAIHHKSVRHCVAIWRSYIKFEVDNGNLRQAKAIFYQALQNCAWVKALYLDIVKLFPELYQDVYDMMVEKELRIRAPQEEIELLLETQ